MTGPDTNPTPESDMTDPDTNPTPESDIQTALLAMIEAGNVMRAVAREHGYALAVHGSLKRDIDLIAAPWVESASDAETLAVALRNAVHGAFGQENEADARPHGRHTWAIHVPGAAYFDLSVMPTSAAIEARGERRAVERIVAWHNEMRDRHDRMGQQHGFSTKAFEHAVEADRHHRAAQDIERGEWRTPATGAGGESDV